MSHGDYKDFFRGACDGDLELVRHHLHHGVDVDFIHPELMTTALVAAIQAGRADVALVLLDHGADPALRSPLEGTTPLEAAEAAGLGDVTVWLRAALGKVDFKKSYDSYRARSGEFRLVDVPAMQYLMVDGHGDPNTSKDYADALAALYPVAYSLKFSSKRNQGRDYVVPPLEALWWAADMAAFTSARDKSQWYWTAMIMTPDWISAQLLADTLEAVAAKDPPASLGKVRLETLEEGRCVQTLHTGPYDAEAGVLADLHDHFIPESGLRMSGKHHEIYLNDARRVEPAKLRTILRQPVEES